MPRQHERGRRGNTLNAAARRFLWLAIPFHSSAKATVLVAAFDISLQSYSVVIRMSERAALRSLSTHHTAPQSLKEPVRSTTAMRIEYHQIPTRSSGLRKSLSPGTTCKALYQASTLRTVSLRY